MRYGLDSPAFVSDPYPVYDQIRSTEPIYWSEENKYWLITRYADISSLIHNEHLSSSRISAHASRLPDQAKREFQPLFAAVSSWMLMVDPPDHTRLRGLVNAAFTPKVVSNMRVRIQQLVDGMLESVRSQGQMDVIRDLASPLPATVIAELLGVPLTDEIDFKRWSDDILTGLLAIDASGTKEDKYSVYAAAQKSFLELSNYFREKVQTLRERPEENLLSALVSAEEAGDRLTEEELFANCVLLMIAGHETTTNLIGNGILALLKHEDQKEQLRSQPALIVPAIEELLRYDSPVQKMARFATEDISVADKEIKKGQLVFFCFGAGNRDSERFPNPNQVDIDRKDNKHLAFGHGLHYCLGAALARLEGQIAINSVLRDFPKLALAAPELEWKRNVTLRGLKSLPVVF